VHARTSLIAVVIAFAFATGAAYADGPADVYNDYAQDGQLSCSHSRSALQNVLRSGSINQYGDPYTLARLKLAIRRQLAGGCRAGSHRSQRATGTAARRNGGTGTGNHGTTGTQGSNRTDSGSRANGRSGGTSQQSGPPAPQSAAPVTESNGGNAGFVSERAVIAGLLVAGLAVAGWLTRRGLAARH
jgi:hypothetical protein